MAGEPQHPFPSIGSSGSQRTAGKHCTSTPRPISLQDQLGERPAARGVGLNSKSRLCESSVTLITKRAKFPGVRFKLSGKYKGVLVFVKSGKTMQGDAPHDLFNHVLLNYETQQAGERYLQRGC